MTPIANHPQTNPKRERGPETSPKRQQGSATTSASQPNPIGSLAEIAEPSSTNESHIMWALQEYRTAREAGANPDRHEFLARHADIATELSQCLEALDFVYEAAPKFQDSALEPAGMLQTSEASKTPEVSAEGQPPIPLGDYQIIREIGRGGMGVVYEATQLSLGRRVALKVLPLAGALDARQLQRFKNEAQAAAHLQHQNIVPVYFVGCERGVHFYAMQFVEGQTLAALIHELRQASQETPSPSSPGSPHIDPQATGPYTSEPKSPAMPDDDRPEAENGAGTIVDRGALIETVSAPPRSSILDSGSSFFRTVANLGIQAAEALEHAHQLGVIHRDIKPANLMVENSSFITHHSSLRLWITDFGLAHCQGGCELTMSGDLLGTLRYMSPEQALAQRVLVDQRTDIYSLGVTLYELLTLEPAFPGTDRQELLRQIAFEEPKPPRRLNKAIPAELETIVLKAMEKNPTDRYATAREFANDLERYQKHEPIRARRPTFRQRTAKWMRRHPGVTIAVGASAVLLLALVACGLAVNNYLIAQKQEETDKARRRADEANRQSQRNLEMALETLDKIYFQLVEQLLPRDPQRQKEYRQLLENAVKFYEQFAEQNRDDSTVRHEVGGAYRRVGSIYQLLGRYDKANEAWTKWGQVVAELAAEFPGESIYRAELGGSYYNLGTLLQEEGARQAAEDHYRYAFVVWDQLAKDFPENPMYRRCVACAYRSLGDLYRADGKWGSAAERYHQTIDLMTRVVNERPDALKYLGELANVRNELGTALKEQGEWVAAKKQYREAIDILTDVVKKCPAVHQNPTELKYNKAPSVHEFRADLASAHYNFGELLMEDGDWKLAEEHHGEALGLRKQLVKDCPAIPQYSLGLAESLINLGSRLHEDGECAEAELNYGQAIGLLTKLVNNHPGLPEYRLDLARGQRSLASLLADVGRSAEGDKALDDALARCQELTKRWPGVPEYLEELATGWLLLGDLRAARGREREAKDAWRKFLELAPDTRHTQERKAWLLATCFDPEFRNPDQAILLAKKATDKAPRSRRAWQALGVASYRAGDWKAAADALNESLRFSKSGHAASGFFLAMTHWQQEDKEQAHKCFDQAAEAMKKSQANQHALRRFRAEAAQLLDLNGRKSKGEEALPQKN